MSVRLLCCHVVHLFLRQEQGKRTAAMLPWGVTLP
jgi:hypothetical protein